MGNPMKPLDRRTLIAAAAAAAASPAIAAAAPAAPASAPPNAEDVRLDALLSAQLEKELDDNPELATSLGLDVKDRAHQRAELADRSLEALQRRRAEVSAKLGALRAIDRDKLGAAAKVSFDVALFRLTSQAERNAFSYGGQGSQPYVVSQQQGAYQQLPDFLSNQHPLKTAEDVSAFEARLGAFETALDHETARVKADADAGVLPPDFLLDKTLAQLASLWQTPGEASPMVAAFNAKSKKAAIPGYEQSTPRLVKLIDEHVRPAAQRQYDLLTALRAKATSDAGVWKLPNGEAFYAYALKANTTTTLKAEEIHQLGKEQVAALQGQIDALLKGQGLTQGSLAERLDALGKDARFAWADTDEAKAALVASLNGIVAQISPMLPRDFKTLPKAKVEIRRVPKEIEIGASQGYYQRPTLDGSRPGIYYINLRTTDDWPKWRLPTLTAHEAVPGHHLQNAVLLEAGELPLYRRLGGFPAYGEGWGLYAERLVDELGLYKNDPFGKIGYLTSYLFRATRLVVDTGLHAKKWTREQAIQFMIENGGEPPNAAANEIDRYCANPGQACSYKLGQTVIANLRANAEKKLGKKFDLRAFHEVVLKNGSLPLTVLERVVGSWQASRAA